MRDLLLPLECITCIAVAVLMDDLLPPGATGPSREGRPALGLGVRGFGVMVLFSVLGSGVGFRWWALALRVGAVTLGPGRWVAHAGFAGVSSDRGTRRPGSAVMRGFPVTGCACCVWPVFTCGPPVWRYGWVVCVLLRQPRSAVQVRVWGVRAPRWVLGLVPLQRPLPRQLIPSA